MNTSEVLRQKDQRRIQELEQTVKDLRARAAGRSAELDQEKVNLQAKYEVASRQLVKLVRREHKVAEYVAEVQQAVKALDPIPRVNFHRPKKSKTPITALLHVTDWHIGHYVSVNETEGWGRFSWDIAQDRVMEQMLPRFKSWLDTQRSGYVINDICLLGTGDWVSGDIHPELRVTNEFPLPVQTAKAGDLFAHLGRELAAQCETLHVKEVGGDNHGRLTVKGQMAQKSQNNMGYLVYHIANASWRKTSNVKVEQNEAMKMLFTIGNTPFLAEHGDTVKSWAGIPWYGIERELAREATNRMFDNRGFKYLVIGHFHKRFFGDIIVGGSLSGTDEYDRSCGRVSPPTQTAMLVGKRGPFNFVPFELR
jgi:hypothetical protein